MLALTARSPSSLQQSVPGPVRRVRTQKKKKPAGYGLFFSSDEEEGDEEDQVQPSPPHISSTKITTTSMTTTTPKSPVSQRAGLKSLVLEKKQFTQGKSCEELFGTPPLARTTNNTPARSSTSVAPLSARAARTSPYGAPAPLSRRPNQVSPWSGDDNDEVSKKMAVGRNKYTMKGGIHTPPSQKRSVAQVATQAREERPQPAAIPAPVQASPFKAISGFLSAATGLLRRTAVVQHAELLRETDVEITPQSSYNGSPVSSEQAEESKEEEEEKNWPGSFNKTPVKEAAQSEYVNPALALEPYARKPVRSIPPWSFDDGQFSKRNRQTNTDKKKLRVSLSHDGQSRSWSLNRRQIPDLKGSVSTNVDASKKARLSLDIGSLSPEEKERIAQERLMELEQAERDRKVQAAEDRYERRMILHQLGRDWWSVEKEERKKELGEESTDDDSATEETRKNRKERKEKSKDKGKEKSASTSPEIRAASPPAEPTPPASEPSSFLFGGGAYKGPTTTTTPTTAPVVAAPSSPTKSLVPSAKSPAPPATPTLSHATFPNPAAPTGSALLPPPAPPSQTSPQKAVSGLGFADPALKARSQAEKFKPHVSSGLRASTTAPVDSPPRANRGAVNPTPFFSPAKVPASTPLSDKTKSVPAPVSTQKAMKYGPQSDWVRAQMDAAAAKADPRYLDIFLEALGGGKKEEKVVHAVDNVWTQPREDEVKGVLKAMFDAIVEFNFAPL